MHIVGFVLMGEVEHDQIISNLASSADLHQLVQPSAALRSSQWRQSGGRMENF